MSIYRDATNKIQVDGRATLASPRFLLHFYSTQTCANVYCITTNSGGSGGPLLLTFDEVGDSGTVAPTAGDIKLSPPGWWELSIYEQTSTTNLDPANATRLVASMGVEVVGESCTASAYTPNQCPDGGDCNPVNLDYEQPNGGTGDIATVDAGDTYEVRRIAFTCADNVVLHFFMSALAGRWKPGDPIQIPPGVLIYDEGGPNEAFAVPMPGGKILFVDQGGNTGQALGMSTPSYPGITDDFFKYKIDGADVPRIVVTHADDSVYKTSDLERLTGGLTTADLKLSGVGIYTTDGNALLTTRKDGQDYDLLPVRLNYTNSDGDDVELGTYAITGIAGPAFEIDKLFARIALRNTVGDVLQWVTLASLDGWAIDVPDGTVNIANSDNSYTDSEDAPSNRAVNFPLPDITVTEPDGGTSSYPSVKDLDIRNYKSGIAYRFGYPFWTGESTSYGTGSEGNLLAAGWFDFTTPPYPETLATIDPGAGNPFLTLAANNSFGNTNRFTDELGGQTYANNLVIDHLTGIMWYRVLLASANWSTALSNAQASTAGGYNDWQVPPEKILESIMNYGIGGTNLLNYAPFSMTSDIWTSTTRAGASTDARCFRPGTSGNTVNQPKTATLFTLLCRKHLV